MMTFDQLTEFCDPISVTGTKPGTIGKLCSDSRKVEPGDIFIAVKGLTVDGHDFIQKAIENGAGVIIAERPVELKNDISAIIVKSTRELLCPLAQFMQGNPGNELKIIGVTGTNGKTTVATLIWQALTKLGRKASLLGTVEKRINDTVYESRLTTADPIELATDMRKMVDAGSDYLVMEVSSHALHQERVRGIRFEVAIFTNLSHDHLDYHGSVDEYAHAKKKLFDSLGEFRWAVTNLDDKYGEWMVQDTKARVLPIAFEKDALINGSILKSSASQNIINLEGTQFRTPLIGKFNAYNVAQAMVACTALGYDGALIAKKLQDCKGAPGRMERVLNDNPSMHPYQPVVIVDYAHTPDALENVCSTLTELKLPGQMLTVVFGCGGDRDKTKRPVMARMAENYADSVIVTSDNPRTEDPQAIIEDIMGGFSKDFAPKQIIDRKIAIETAIREADEDTIILIAGKGHETYQEINGERSHFDDREIARAALMSRNGKPQSSEVH